MTCRFVKAIATLSAGYLLFVHQARAQDDQVVVFASNGIKGVLEELKPQCELAIGHPLTVQFNSTAALKQRIESGASFDVAILTADTIDDLIQKQKIAAGSRAELARGGIGIGVHTGVLKPDVSSPKAVKEALLRARSITYSKDGASKVYIEKMFDGLGITADVKPKVVFPDGAESSTVSVANGKVELVLTLISEILPVRGLELAGPLPEAFQNYIAIRAGVSATANQPGAAKALIQFLRGQTAAPVFKVKGMEPR